MTPVAATAPIRVVVAGGGVAGLETLMALRALAGERVELTLVAPQGEFVYRPLAVEPPFTVGRARRIALDQAARDADARFVAEAVEAVDADHKRVSPSGGDTLEYDALVLAVGATAAPVIAHAVTWDDHSDAETLRGMLEDIEEGYSRRLAIVVPPGPGWPLRGYELAIFISKEASSVSVDVETTIVTPEPSPLEALGSKAVEQVSDELQRAGVELVSGASADVEPGHTETVVVQPSGRRIEVDRVIALPGLHGHPVAGIPADADGFIDIDEHCRVRGLDGVWAAGDVTSFTVKSGGFAAEQARVVATDIAASAGAAVERRPFDPASMDALAGLPVGGFLEKWLTADEDDELTTGLPATGVPILTYMKLDLEASSRGRP
jgi:sulfide:quinone oxidoreductase